VDSPTVVTSFEAVCDLAACALRAVGRFGKVFLQALEHGMMHHTLSGHGPCRSRRSAKVLAYIV
jgi:hypothetical protein